MKYNNIMKISSKTNLINNELNSIRKYLNFNKNKSNENSCFNEIKNTE